LGGNKLTELNIVAFEMADLGASKDSKVLELSSADGGAVVSDEDELGLSLSHRFDGELVAYKLKRANS